MESWVTVHLQQPHLSGAHEGTISLHECTCRTPTAVQTFVQRRLTHRKVLVDHEVAANQVEEAQSAVQLGFDRQETLRHDLLHALLRHGRGKKKKNKQSVKQQYQRMCGWDLMISLLVTGLAAFTEALSPYEAYATCACKQLPSYTSSRHEVMFSFIWRCMSNCPVWCWASPVLLETRLMRDKFVGRKTKTTSYKKVKISVD